MASIITKRLVLPVLPHPSPLPLGEGESQPGFGAEFRHQKIHRPARILSVIAMIGEGSKSCEEAFGIGKLGGEAIDNAPPRANIMGAADAGVAQW